MAVGGKGVFEVGVEGNNTATTDSVPGHVAGLAASAVPVRRVPPTSPATHPYQWAPP